MSDVQTLSFFRKTILIFSCLFLLCRMATLDWSIERTPDSVIDLVHPELELCVLICFSQWQQREKDIYFVKSQSIVIGTFVLEYSIYDLSTYDWNDRTCEAASSKKFQENGNILFNILVPLLICSLYKFCVVLIFLCILLYIPFLPLTFSLAYHLFCQKVCWCQLLWKAFKQGLIYFHA